MRTNKLAVTVFALGLAAAYGCSSSNEPTPGSGGSGGGAAGRGGSAGTAAAGTSGGGTGGSPTAGTGGSPTAGTGGSPTAGTGGSPTAGTGGSPVAGTGGSPVAGTGGSPVAGTGGGPVAGTGGGAAGRGGAGGGAAGTGGSPAGSGGMGGVQMTNCTSTVNATGAALTAAIFCQNYIANCPSVAGYESQTTCEVSYTLATAGQQSCRSYHLCWGVEGLGPTGGGMPGPHCPHTRGSGACN